MKKNEEYKEENDAGKFRQQCFESLKKYVKGKMILEGQFLRMTTIANYYRQLQESVKLQVKGDTPRNIKSRLIHAFGDKLSFFQKSSRASEIVYYDMDYREKVFVFGEDKIKEVRKLIKSKIEELPIRTSWPPNPDDLRQEKIQMPHLLELLLTTLLTNETVSSERVKRLMKSFDQDIIYNFTHGKLKTAKHTELGVSVKRKTGSRLLIECINRLGHTISYHEVNSLKTVFSGKHVKHQLVRAYVPPAVQPSTSLTFVYDNCDHNSETLTGATMHCSNGIIIQRKSGNDQPDEAPTEENTNSSVQRKYFAPVDIDIRPYHQLQRVSRDKIAEIERNTNIYKEYLSKKGDLLWILLRRQKTYNTDNGFRRTYS